MLSQQQIEQYYIPLLKRLSHGEWFTSRTSSAALYAPVYLKVSPSIQEELRKGYTALGSDDTPMVRRAAAKWLGVRGFWFIGVSSGLMTTAHALGLRQEPFEAARPHRWAVDIPPSTGRRPGLCSIIDG